MGRHQYTKTSLLSILFLRFWMRNGDGHSSFGVEKLSILFLRFENIYFSRANPKMLLSILFLRFWIKMLVNVL